MGKIQNLALRQTNYHARCIAAEETSLHASLGRGILFIHLVLSPLVFSNDTVEVFEYNKVALLWVTAIALVGLGLSALTTRGAPIIQSNSLSSLLVSLRRHCNEPIALGFMLFLGSAALSAWTSISPHTSLWGANESFAGLFTIGAYTVLFFVTRGLCRTFSEARTLLAAPLVATAVTSTYGLMQVVHADPIPWIRTSGIGSYVRPFSTLGHPNFLAAYLVMALPVIGYFGVRAVRSGRKFALILVGLIGLMSCMNIVLALSRGAWLAAVGMLVVLGGGAFGLGIRTKWLARIGGCVGLAIVLVMGTCFLLPTGTETLELVRIRGAHLAEIGGRKYIWRAGIEALKERPVFGSGLDTFPLAFAKHGSPDFWRAEWNHTPVKAHNEVIHVLATQGLVGGAAILIMGGGIILAFRRAWINQPVQARLLLLLVIEGIAGFAIQVLFSFTVAGCGTLFVTLAAVLSRWGEHPPEPPSQNEPAPWPGLVHTLALAAVLAALVLGYNTVQVIGSSSAASWWGCLAVATSLGVSVLVVLQLECSPAGWMSAWQLTRMQPSGPANRVLLKRRIRTKLLQATIWIGVGLVIIMGVFRPMQANRLCWQGERLVTADAQQGLEQLERAVAIDPGVEHYWNKLAEASQLVANAASEPEERFRHLNRARYACERSIDLVPLNASSHADLGRVLAKLAAEGQASRDEVFAAFDRAIALDRKNAYFYADAGALALSWGENARADYYAREVLHIYPDFAPAQAQLGFLALQEKRWPDAVQLLQQALRADWHDDAMGLVIASTNFAAALLQVGMPEQALIVTNNAIQGNPEYIPAQCNRARALEVLGRREEAAAEYQSILGRSPNHALALAGWTRLVQGNPRR